MTYGSSLGLREEEVGIGVKVDVSKLTPAKCRQFLCGTKVRATMNADPNSGDDTAGQTKMIDDVDEIEVDGEIKGFSTSPKGISFRLIMADSVNLDDLKKLRHRTGKLCLELLS